MMSLVNMAIAADGPDQVISVMSGGYTAGLIHHYFFGA
jgi:hypothetical protein